VAGFVHILCLHIIFPPGSTGSEKEKAEKAGKVHLVKFFVNIIKLLQNHMNSLIFSVKNHSRFSRKMSDTENLLSW